jgi:hypothetical protein
VLDRVELQHGDGHLLEKRKNRDILLLNGNNNVNL